VQWETGAVAARPVLKATKSKKTMAQNLKRLMKRFGDEMGKLAFADPVAYVYNPLDYAWAGQEAFIHKFFGRPTDAATNEDDPEPRPTMLVGMNPGPYGMTQSGTVASIM
jgi:single-strand selective monofunctional uracil DNA glycosylase